MLKNYTIENIFEYEFNGSIIFFTNIWSNLVQQYTHV
jgi:hypothetical protein